MPNNKDNDRKKRKQLIGTVISNKMDKSVVVLTERKIKHPMYGKYVKRQSKFMSHDKDNMCNIGDKVLITESKPLSKTKRFRVSKLISKAKGLA